MGYTHIFIFVQYGYNYMGSSGSGGSGGFAGGGSGGGSYYGYSDGEVVPS